MIIKIIIIAAAIAVAVVAAVLIYRHGIYYRLQDKWLVNLFENGNVLVWGAKGKGKDVLFSHVINKRRQKHYSNIRYNELTKVIKLKQISAGKNTYENLINGKIDKFNQFFEEEKDVYISDAGICLPSQYNSALDKVYAGMPLYFALSRHLSNHNIHANTQAFSRLWNKLREQADGFIKIKERYIFDRFIILRIISYETAESAERGLLPPRRKDRGLFYATHGEIKERFIKVYKRDIKYNTRAFRDIFIVEEVPTYLQEKI